MNSGDPWNPLPSTIARVRAMLQGVHRVLNTNGIFISISFGQVGQIRMYVFVPKVVIFYFHSSLLIFVYLQPHFRRPLFEDPEFTWSVEWSTFGDGFHYFCYILKKVGIYYFPSSWKSFKLPCAGIFYH